MLCRKIKFLNHKLLNELFKIENQILILSKLWRKLNKLKSEIMLQKNTVKISLKRNKKLNQNIH